MRVQWLRAAATCGLLCPRRPRRGAGRSRTVAGKAGNRVPNYSCAWRRSATKCGIGHGVAAEAIPNPDPRHTVVVRGLSEKRERPKGEFYSCELDIFAASYEEIQS